MATGTSSRDITAPCSHAQMRSPQNVSGTRYVNTKHNPTNRSVTISVVVVVVEVVGLAVILVVFFCASVTK